MLRATITVWCGVVRWSQAAALRMTCGARRRTRSPTSNVTRPRNLSQKGLPGASSGPYSSGMSWSVSECTTGESGDSAPYGRSGPACRCAHPQAAQQPLPT